MLFDLKAKCPECQATVHVEGGEAAEFTYKRTCRKCRRVWSILVEPLKTAVEGMWMHKLTWTPHDAGRQG